MIPAEAPQSAIVQEIDACVAEYKTKSEEAEVLAIRVGNLMRELRDTPGALRALRTDDAQEGYSSIHDFMKRHLKLVREKGALYNWLTIATAQIPQPLIKEMGLMVSLDIAKQAPEPGLNREHLIERLREARNGDVTLPRRKAQDVIAGRNNVPVEAVKTGYVGLYGSEEDANHVRVTLDTLKRDNPGMTDIEGVRIALDALMA